MRDLALGIPLTYAGLRCFEENVVVLSSQRVVARPIWQHMFLGVLATLVVASMPSLGTSPAVAEQWEEVRKRTASDASTGDQFGYSVAIDGDTAVVGARLVGAGGAVYVFERNRNIANNWGEAKLLMPLVVVPSANFGFSVAIDGDTIGVGAPLDSDGMGAAYVFERNLDGPGSWGQAAKFTGVVLRGDFGHAVAVSGDAVVVGSKHAGVSVFQRDQGGTNSWGKVKDLVPFGYNSPGELGSSVALDGDFAVLGARGDGGSGSAFIFGRNEGGTDNWGQVKKLTGSNPTTGAGFGSSVSISANTVAVGALHDDIGCPPLTCNDGSVYVFERDEGGTDNWGEVAKLTASDAFTQHLFGTAVSVSGTTIIVGTDKDNDLGTQSGAVYIFERTPGDADSWPEVAKLGASDAAAEDYFGWSAAISGNTVVVGAWGNDDDGDKSGAAYIFEQVPADLSVTISDSLDPVAAGSQFTYSVTVANSGPADAEHVMATMQLPPEVAVVFTNGCIEDPLAVPECSLGTIPAGTQATYVVIVMVDSGADGVITSQVDVTSSTPELNPGDEGASESTTVEAIGSNLIFADDFESGNTSAWSAVVQGP